MSNRISMAVQKAVDLWRENPNLTIAADQTINYNYYKKETKLNNIYV